jgi:hypothetical protein
MNRLWKNIFVEVILRALRSILKGNKNGKKSRGSDEAGMRYLQDESRNLSDSETRAKKEE